MESSDRKRLREVKGLVRGGVGVVAEVVVVAVLALVRFRGDKN